MPTISSSTVHNNHATLDVVVDVPDLLVTNFQVTIDNDRSEVPFLLTINQEVYNRLTGDHTFDRACIAFDPEEFRQFLTMVTDFASLNGFIPVRLPSA